MEPYFSIVMPAYNAEKFISEAIKSVINQTFKQWELIIVDDHSTDDTVKIAKWFSNQDARIRLYQREFNSGTAYIPRKEAFLKATADYAVMLDADDEISTDYLSQIWQVISTTKADVIYSKVLFFEKDHNDITNNLPAKDFDANKSYHGKELIKYTLNGWKIGLWGTFSMTVIRKFYQTYSFNAELVQADELMGRQILLIAERVAFSQGVYYYRNNYSSITKAISIRNYDVFITLQHLSNLIKQNFATDSEENILVEIEKFNTLFGKLGHFQKYKDKFSHEEQKRIKSILKTAYKELDWSIISTNISKSMRFYLMRVGIPLTNFCLRLYFILKKIACR